MSSKGVSQNNYYSSNSGHQHYRQSSANCNNQRSEVLDDHFLCKVSWPRGVGVEVEDLKRQQTNAEGEAIDTEITKQPEFVEAETEGSEVEATESEVEGETDEQDGTEESELSETEEPEVEETEATESEGGEGEVTESEGGEGEAAEAEGHEQEVGEKTEAPEVVEPTDAPEVAEATEGSEVMARIISRILKSFAREANLN